MNIISLFPLGWYLYVQSLAFCPKADTPFSQLFGCSGKTVYSFVEEKYWNVKLFGYYSFNHVFVICTNTLVDNRLYYRFTDCDVLHSCIAFYFIYLFIAVFGNSFIHPFTYLCIHSKYPDYYENGY